MKDICRNCFDEWEKQAHKELVHFYKPSLDKGEQCEFCGRRGGLLEYLK